MKQTQTCIKCGSKSVLSEVPIAIKNYPNQLEIRVPTESKSIFSAQYERADVKAWVCSDCGYLELYVG